MSTHVRFSIILTLKILIIESAHEIVVHVPIACAFSHSFHFYVLYSGVEYKNMS